jgi:hypothetical protein
MFGLGTDLKPPQAAVVRSNGSERCGSADDAILAGTVERGECKQEPLQNRWQPKIRPQAHLR